MISKPIITTELSHLPIDCNVIEAYESAIKELFFLDNPQFKKGLPGTDQALQNYLQTSSVPETWIFYPWKNTIIHSVDEETYFKLRTARNRDIITPEEQIQFRNSTVAVVGLSVGSAIVQSLVINGGPKYLKIADFDTLEITNLNRIKGTLLDIGSNKTELAAKNVWELDPFAELSLYDKGINKDNLETFLFNPTKTEIFIDEMDSIDLKIYSRLLAKKNRIPVLMATDNGDSIILDVERFDLEPDREIFHGLLGDIGWEQAENLNFKDWLKLATKIVSPKFLTERMMDSILGIGKHLASVPQLGTTANIAGAAMAFAVRRICNKQDFPSGRFTLGLENIFIPDYNSEEKIKERGEKLNNFINSFIDSKK
jgi:hypothetical protein